jgi:hypothetical protein
MDDLIRMAEAAKVLGIERETAYRYAADGKFPVVEIAGHKFVRRSDLAGVQVGAHGWAPRKVEDARSWTPAMTRKRLDEWNAAVESGAFDAEDGGVDKDKIAAWEKSHGWTHTKLARAVKRLSKKGAEE